LVVSVSALDRDLDQATFDEAPQVRRRGRRRHGYSSGEFTGGQRSAVRQRDEHRGPGRVTEQPPNGRQVDVARIVGHRSSMTHAHFDQHRNVAGIASRV